MAHLSAKICPLANIIKYKNFGLSGCDYRSRPGLKDYQRALFRVILRPRDHLIATLAKLAPEGFPLLLTSVHYRR